MNNPLQPRSHHSMDLAALGTDRSIHGILGIGSVEVLFTFGKPMAVWSGSDVFFPDTEMSRTVVKHLNAFRKTESRTRVVASEFDFILASALMGQLRPLTRGPE